MAKKILLIEDDADMIDIVTQILEAEGYAVDAAFDGDSAFKKLGTFKPDLVITDVMIPKLDGWKICQTIRKNESSSHVPILIVSALDKDMDELMSYESGADEYISKPFNNEELVKTVRRLLEKGALRQEKG